MSSIKLTADSGGGTFEIKAPSSSGNTRVLTLPDTGNGDSSNYDRYEWQVNVLTNCYCINIIQDTRVSSTSWYHIMYAISGLTCM